MDWTDVDEALKRAPRWEPPAGFAPRVAALAHAEAARRPPAAYRHGVDWFDVALRTAVATVAAALGGWLLWRASPALADPATYQRLVETLASALAGNPVAASWISAVVAVLVAARSARLRLV